ncbi:ribonuclease 3 [Cylas formicarius]|uniref:ribonuclease 3 n=1 Tax=Cylas formicarius TaxID=197179 RepID=UPI002958C9D8|nr:ribonuclease 3 [Cylas formicarius]
MEEHWYYGQQCHVPNSGPSHINYVHYPPPQNQSAHFMQWQQASPQLPVPPYPPPVVGPYTIPPPNFPPSSSTYDYSYQQSVQTSSSQYQYYQGSSNMVRGHDYKKELDDYRAVKKASIRDSPSGYNQKRSGEPSSSMSASYSKGNRSRSRSVSRIRNSAQSRDTSRYVNKNNPRERECPKDKYKGKDTARQVQNERDEILNRYKRNYCHTEKQISQKLEEISRKHIDFLDQEKNFWIRSTPSELFYQKDESNLKITKATDKLIKLCLEFDELLVSRALKVNSLKSKYVPPPRKNRSRVCKHRTEVSTSSDSESSEDNLTDEENFSMEELQRKQQHPDRLHPEMWYNDPGEMNDGPLCRCSFKSKKSGIRHGIYPGEKNISKCNPHSNNADRLYHYRIIISPPTNFLIKAPTIIQHDEHEFIFEGFSIFSHAPLVQLPHCKVIRFNIEYTIMYLEEKIPDNFTVCELDMFTEYLFREVLELIDLDLTTPKDSEYCSQFHYMPRFVRELNENGKEILCMEVVLQYLLNCSVPLIQKNDLKTMVKMSQYEWQHFADEIKGMVVTYPGKKPSSVRVDQLDRNIDLQKEGDYKFPEIVHFGIRPPQLSYAGNPEYQKAWREYVKYRHLIANMSKPTFEDKRKLEAKEGKLQEIRTQGKMKRDVTIAVSAEGFYRTGIMCDIVQHAMLIPVLICHLRFHNALNVLEESIEYKFKNRGLLQIALTHPSYRQNFGTNPDHARNSLTNCGIRQPEYGDRRIHYMNTRKRGINTLINIMSRFGRQQETESNITHNERLEFLGDAVVEFLSSIHLFFSFPDLEEGGLATYRAAIVQNQHLALLAKILNLDQFMLYAHGSDLCHDLELKHAMANCFEALMGALFLDGGIDVADKVFSNTLYQDEPELLKVWKGLPLHPLQEQEPHGDRHWIEKFEILQKLTGFEKAINVEFNHIRLLARAFTDRSVGYTNLTMGSNQRLEFLGDTVLQLIASEYLYKYFPEHHEGHLSLLRSSLVNNRTQAVVCDDLGMAQYAIYNNPKPELKTKDRADLLEAFIGALYVDKGMEYCEVFCQVTLFPRLQDFIMNQDWNDPKSKLQQCCLTLRTMDGGEPDIPVYKVIECKGPTNTRVYTVAVYFRGRRLASAMGHSIQQAEMNAAKKALEISHHLFPQLDHQKRVIAKSMKKQKKGGRSKSRSFDSLRRKSPESYSRNRFKSRSRSRSTSRSKRSRSRGDRLDSNQHSSTPKKKTSRSRSISSSSSSSSGKGSKK